MVVLKASSLPRRMRQQLGLEPARSKYNVDISDEGRVERSYKGDVYDSLAEKHYAQLLDVRVRALDIVSWRRQVRIGELIVDFEILHRNGTVEFIEIKGVPTAEWKRKYHAFQGAFPGILYRVLRERPDGAFEEHDLKTRRQRPIVSSRRNRAAGQTESASQRVQHAKHGSRPSAPARGPEPAPTRDHTPTPEEESHGS